MTAHATFSDYGSFSARKSKPQISVCETPWGYVIGSDTRLNQRSALIERVCVVAGIAFVLASLGGWLLPQVQAAVPLSGVGIAPRIVSALSMLMPALLFLWISERGLGQEVQVDIEERCLRQCVSNRRGTTRTQRKVQFDAIGSAFIRPGVNVHGIAQLFVRLTDGRSILHLASGREATMRILHERLSHDLHPARPEVKGWEWAGLRLMPAAT